MLTKTSSASEQSARQPEAVAIDQLAEREFYESYRWALNPFPTVAEARGHLRDEIAKLTSLPDDWRIGEVAINIYLLSCGILDSAEKFLRGRNVRLPGKLGSNPLAKSAYRFGDFVANNPAARQRMRVARWRDNWLAALHDFLLALVKHGDQERVDFALAAIALGKLVGTPLPTTLEATRIGIPSPFRRLDLTHHDVIVLGRLLAATCRTNNEKLLLVGLRTSGSYFAPLIRAVLHGEGLINVAQVTIEPDKGAGRWERRALRSHAQTGHRAIIVDDPPHSGKTIYSSFAILKKSGFPLDRIIALAPTHPAKPNWYRLLPAASYITLPPSHWHKLKLLERGPDPDLLARYFMCAPKTLAVVKGGGQTPEIQAQIVGNSPDQRMQRLKRVYRIDGKFREGRKGTKYVMAKSVGWGWLGYHAFLAGHYLRGMVPPMLTLRAGIFYSEYFPQTALDDAQLAKRKAILAVAPEYVAARVRHLSLSMLNSSALNIGRHSNGLRLLEKAMSRNYGRFPLDILMRGAIGRQLRPLFSSRALLIDGAMQSAEWILHNGTALKADFEHHGLGKGPANVVDPAFDLADLILSLQLSRDEEQELLARYRAASGDAKVEERLVLSKLAAGLWSMNQAQEQIHSSLAFAATLQREHGRFMAAWHFLTVVMAEFCGRLYGPPSPARWQGPIVALDIDGVIDSRHMGFPATTLAGAQALALLSAKRISVIVNTARSVAEVKEYCRAYGLAGAVAEHGAYMWDAVANRGKVLIGGDVADQLETLRNKLRSIPGVFLDERHLYSIRAFTYPDHAKGKIGRLFRSLRASEVGDGAVAPLPSVMMNQMMGELGLHLLSVHNTNIDTTITAKTVNKGSGLVAIRNWVLGPRAQTIAVGDQEPDLTMFAVATQSYAPANISCADQARLLGCKIAEKPVGIGLLAISREISSVHGEGSNIVPELMHHSSLGEQLLIEVLSNADVPRGPKLIRALFNSNCFGIFGR